MINDKWIPVSERMPEEGKMVAVLCRYEFAPDKYILSSERYNHESYMWHDGAAQYWFPLPEVPQEENEYWWSKWALPDASEEEDEC